MLAVATAAVLAGFSGDASAAFKWWDTAATAGLQSGTGTWDAAGGTNWAVVANPGAVAPGAWNQGDDAVFGSSGTNNPVNIVGVVHANSLTQISNTFAGTGTLIQGGTLEIGAGGVTTSLSNPMVINSAVNLRASQTWNLATALTVGGSIGETASGFGITKTGANSLTLTSANTYSGATDVRAGSLVVNGAGTLQNTSALTVAAGAKATLDYAANGTLDRLNNAASLTIGGEFILNGNTTDAVNESVGVVTAGPGSAIITMTPAAGKNLRLSADGLARSGAGTLLVRGNAFGINPLTGATANAANVSLKNAPSYVGSTATSGTAKGILPWAVGDGSAGSNGSDFLTYDGTYDVSTDTYTGNGLRRLVAAEYKTTFDGTADNFKLASANLSITTDTAVNSLTFTGTSNVNGAGTLTVNSGGILAVGTTNIGVTTPGTLNFGATEGIVHAIGNVNVGSAITGAGGLTKSGINTLFLVGANGYSGTTTVNQGTLQLGSSITGGSTSGDLGTSSSVVLQGGNLTVNRSNAFAFNGSITGIVTSADGSQGKFTQSGTGTTTLGGTNAIPGRMEVTNGTLVLTGTNTTGATNTGAHNTIGGAAGTLATLNLTGSGSLNAINGNVNVGSAAGRARASVQGMAALTSGGALNVGAAGSGAGAIHQSGGTVAVSSPVVTSIAIGNGGYGYYDLSAGSLSSSGTTRIGNGTNTVGVLYQSGGNFVSTGHLDLVGGGSAAAPGHGVYYMTGGTYTSTGNAAANLSYTAGRSQLTIANATMTLGALMTVGNTVDSTAILNLNSGGTIQSAVTNAIYTSPGAAVGTGVRNVNFNGGTLRHTGTNSVIQVGTSDKYSVYVLGGGATFDVVNSTGGGTVAQPLLAPSGDGVSGTTYAIANGGSGYLGAPAVTISGVSGATAIANMVDDATGNGTFKVASITITTPGQNATAPVFSFIGGGFTTAADPTGVALATATNATTGGITKTGLGTLTLSAANTYGGATTIEAGKLTLAATGTINNSAGINVKAGATFDIAAKNTALLNGYTVNGIKGAGTVVAASGRALTVAGGGTIAPGDSIGTLTITGGNLGLTDGIVYDYEIGGTTEATISDLINLTSAGGTVVGLADGNFTLNLFNLGTVDPTAKEFVLIDYSNTGVNPLNAGAWTINYGTTGWGNGIVSVDTVGRRVVLSGVEVTTAVPEPATLGLIGLGIIGLLARQRRQVGA